MKNDVLTLETKAERKARRALVGERLEEKAKNPRPDLVAAHNEILNRKPDYAINQDLKASSPEIAIIGAAFCLCFLGATLKFLILV